MCYDKMKRPSQREEDTRSASERKKSMRTVRQTVTVRPRKNISVYLTSASRVELPKQPNTAVTGLD